MQGYSGAVRRLRSDARPLGCYAALPRLTYDRGRELAATRPTTSGPATWLWISDTARTALASGDLALIIRTYRAATGTSQRCLAELLGYDPTYISMIETGRREISDVVTRLRIARRLGLPAHTLGVSDPGDADFTAMLQFGESTIRLAAIARQSGRGAEAVNELWPLVTRLESRVADGHVERDVMRGDRLEGSQPERLATEHDPVAYAAHRLRTTLTLAELHTLHYSRPQRVVDPAVLARAEAAAEAATAATALTDPTARLVGRIGLPPASGPHREVWDVAVAALAVYRARHRPPAPPSEPGPEPGPPPDDDHGQRWREQRAAAERIAADWAASLPAPEADRFLTAAQAIPRARAVAGIHALLDHGHDSQTLAAELHCGGQATVRTGAAVLDCRVRRLLDRQRIDPEPYRGPAPRSQFEEWQRVKALLDVAEAQVADRSTTTPQRSLPLPDVPELAAGL